jgi:hypothetical protein
MHDAMSSHSRVVSVVLVFKASTIDSACEASKSLKLGLSEMHAHILEAFQRDTIGRKRTGEHIDCVALEMPLGASVAHKGMRV